MPTLLGARIMAMTVSLVAFVLLVGGAESPALTEEDPLPADTSWKGKFTQAGTHPDAEFPPELEATLTITRRDGDNVEIELREVMQGLDITFLCRGRVARSADRSLALEFTSYGVKGVPNAAFYLVNVPYQAKIVGNAIKGTWKYVEKTEGIDLGGEYALTRE